MPPGHRLFYGTTDCPVNHSPLQWASPLAWALILYFSRRWLGLGADLLRKLTMSLAPFSEPAGAVPGRWLSPPEACRAARKDPAAQTPPPHARPGVLF